MLLAFHRANPKFGEAGHEHEASTPLPGCLESLLSKQLLKKAKRDTLAKVKRELMRDTQAQAIA